MKLMLEAKDITLWYWNRNILKHANIQIHSGDFVFLIGWSGSGKTSLIKTFIGDLNPKHGTLQTGFFEKNLYQLSKKELLSYRRKIGIVFQDFKLLHNKTVRENVAFAMEVCWYSDTIIHEKVPEILSQVGLLAKKDKFIEALSWGEVQRVSIARALIHNPEIIIGDEPTGNLDPKNAKEIIDILIDLNKNGKTIIIATHDDRIVNALKKRVIAFRDGEIVSDQKEGIYCL